MLPSSKPSATNASMVAMTTLLTVSMTEIEPSQAL
jgi:hypothetical protein